MCNCNEMTKKFEQLDEIIAKHKEERGALIPILHEAQEVFGYLPYEVQERIADGLGKMCIRDSSDSASSILYAVLFTSVVSIGMAAAQRIMSLKECIEVWLGGCKELLLTVTILILAWSSGSVMSDLGTGDFISGMVGNSIPGLILPAVLFLVSCCVAFSTGTSYGTTAIMIPIAFPLAMGVTGGAVDSLAVTTIAAVTCGAIFGDHCSPISDTTIMSSMGSASDLMLSLIHI